MNQIPRLMFFLSAFVGNVLCRSLHCHVGKPRSWFFPPNWS
jgi:hypothetical protein